MDLPKRCGDVYIKFDKKNNPEYGFRIERGSNKKYIKQFIKMTDKKIDTIILPMLIDDNDSISVKDISPDDWSNEYYLLFVKYVTGEVEICENCFKGIKNAKIVIPFDGSVSIAYGSFDKDANIEFVTNSDLRLKHVYRTYDTGFDYAHDNWTLIADKCFIFDGRICGDDYCVRNYYKETHSCNDNKVANIRLSHFNSLTTKEIEK